MLHSPIEFDGQKKSLPVPSTPPALAFNLFSFAPFTPRKTPKSTPLSVRNSKKFISFKRLLVVPDLTPLDQLTEPLFAPLYECASPVSKRSHVTTYTEDKINLSPLKSIVRGPKVKPFIFSQSQQPPHRDSLVMASCFVCEELLQAKMQHEKVVELRCGDYIHSECLTLVVTSQDAPLCSGPKCRRRGSAARVLPVDEVMMSELMSQSLLKRSQSKPKPIGLGLAPALRALSLDYDLDSPTPLPRTTSRPKTYTALMPPSRSHRNSSLAFSPESNRSCSPVSIDTTHTVLVKMTRYINVSLPTLKDHFVRHLLHKCPKLSLTMLLGLGQLRLADILTVTYNGKTSTNTCYLFANYLLIWTHHGVVLQLPLTNIHIRTPHPAKLHIVHKVSQVVLSHDKGPIIEKWGVALSERTFLFPPDLLTSTICLPGFREDTPRRESTITILLDELSAYPTDVEEEEEEEEDEDSDSDEEMVARILSKNPKVARQSFAYAAVPAPITNDIPESDSDSDSDQELIAALSRLRPSKPGDHGWSELHGYIDEAMRQITPLQTGPPRCRSATPTSPVPGGSGP